MYVRKSLYIYIYIYIYIYWFNERYLTPVECSVVGLTSVSLSLLPTPPKHSPVPFKCLSLEEMVEHCEKELSLAVRRNSAGAINAPPSSSCWSQMRTMLPKGVLVRWTGHKIHRKLLSTHKPKSASTHYRAIWYQKRYA